MQTYIIGGSYLCVHGRPVTPCTLHCRDLLQDSSFPYATCQTSSCRDSPWSMFISEKAFGRVGCYMRHGSIALFYFELPCMRPQRKGYGLNGITMVPSSKQNILSRNYQLVCMHVLLKSHWSRIYQFLCTPKPHLSVCMHARLSHTYQFVCTHA